MPLFSVLTLLRVNPFVHRLATIADNLSTYRLLLHFRAFDSISLVNPRLTLTFRRVWGLLAGSVIVWLT